MKYLAVDLGNVICNVNFDPFLKTLSKTLNITNDDAVYFLNRTQKLHDMGLTDIKSELIDYFNIKSTCIIDDLILAWNYAISPNPIMIAALTSLLKDGAKIALLSNIGFEHAEIMRNILTADVFDPSVKFFSCQVGARKPSYLYYKTFKDLFPEFSGCVYLDDRRENIEIGNLFGFKSIEFALDKFTSAKDIYNKIAEIKNLP